MPAKITLADGDDLPDLNGATTPFSLTVSSDDKTSVITKLHSIDIIFNNDQPLKACSKTTKLNGIHLEKAEESAGLSFYRRFRQHAASSQKAYVAARLFFPCTTGYVSWAGVFQSRMVDCPQVIDLFSALKSLQSLSPSQPPGKEDDIPSIFAEAVAGLMIESSSKQDLDKQWLSLDKELIRRFSLPWLSPAPLERTRIAVVEGGFNLAFRQNMLDRALQLGINLVILDKPGHWLASPDHSLLREAFLPMDMTLDDDLPKRIVEAMKETGLKFDGIISFSDSYLVATGTAAEMLNLETSPSTSLAKVVNKHTCRESMKDQPKAFGCTSFEDLMEQVQKSQHPLSYPLVVKPVVGGGSQGVTRVNAEHMLESTIHSLVLQHGKDLAVEPYIDGPEFDVNFVLLDKKIIFCEFSDNLPCAGDIAGAGEHDSFLETGMIYPSALDQSEQDLAKQYLHQALLDLGFSTGVFHVEARMMNSAKEFAVGQNGVLDLQRKEADLATGSSPGIFLLEVNARAPGIQAVTAVTHIYGIDYHVIQLLLAVGATQRAEQLCHSFVGGTQHACAEIVFIPALAGGTFNSDDVVQELMDGEPELKTAVMEYYLMLHRGDKVPDPRQGKLRFVATLLVASDSRQETLRLGAMAQAGVKYSLLPAE